MDNVFGTNYSKDYSDYNDWEKFTAHEKVSPGNSGVGNIHFAPNSETDYDWGNRTPVMSNCANWLNYPDLSGEPKEYTCSEWGNGDIREHHKWWFKHLPHAKGKNAETDKYNNWWIYFTLDYINDPPADIPEPPETSSIEECTFEKVSSVFVNLIKSLDKGSTISLASFSFAFSIVASIFLQVSSTDVFLSLIIPLTNKCTLIIDNNTISKDNADVTISGVMCDKIFSIIFQFLLSILLLFF